MKVVLLDTHTGETRESSDVSSPFWWTEGNGSCDCNREITFGNEDAEGVCIGAHRYLVIAAEFDPEETPCSMRELNRNYPEELLKKHLPMYLTETLMQKVPEIEAQIYDKFIEMNTPQPQATKLPTEFDTCLLGASVAIYEDDKFVYSLRALIQLVMHERGVQPPEARQIILAEFIKPHSREIIFVNDELLEPVEEEKSKIIQPTKVGPRRWKAP